MLEPPCSHHSEPESPPVQVVGSVDSTQFPQFPHVFSVTVSGHHQQQHEGADSSAAAINASSFCIASSSNRAGAGQYSPLHVPHTLLSWEQCPFPSELLGSYTGLHDVGATSQPL